MKTALLPTDPDTPAAVDAAIRESRERGPAILRGLCTFLRIPTVSAEPRHAADVARGARWLAGRLREIGLGEVAVIPTPGHPLVYAAYRCQPRRPTVLMYGHYDVQPTGSAARWTSPPFAPTRRGDLLLARGASDDKGQLWVHLAAIESCLRSSGELPVNVVCLFDGEEEIGSPNLAAVVSRMRRRLAADAAVISDTRLLGPDRPVITYGLRGHVSATLELRGSRRSLHAGAFGGAVHNPLQVMCELVATFHRTDGRVALDGFYRRVRPVSHAERRRLAAHGPTAAALLGPHGVARGWGERGFTAYERTVLRPAIVVHDVAAVPPSQRITAVPAGAIARLGIRLVPRQEPTEVETLLERHVAQLTPRTVRAAVLSRRGSRAWLGDPAHWALQAGAAAYARTFPKPAVFLRSGGTIPAPEIFQRLLDIPTVLLGFGLPDDRAHAPNERLHLPTFFRGIETSLWFLHEVAARRGRNGI